MKFFVKYNLSKTKALNWLRILYSLPTITDVRIELWDRGRLLRHRYHLRKHVVGGRQRTLQLRQHLRGPLPPRRRQLWVAEDEEGVMFQVPRKTGFLRKLRRATLGLLSKWIAWCDLVEKFLQEHFHCDDSNSPLIYQDLRNSFREIRHWILCISFRSWLIFCK